jgi:hypothetical protein
MVATGDGSASSTAAHGSPATSASHS